MKINWQAIIAICAVIGVFLTIYSIVFLNKNKPTDNELIGKTESTDLIGEAECKLITSDKMFQMFQEYNFPNKNFLEYAFSLNKSNDYLADIFYLQVKKKSALNPFMKVDLGDLRPTYFRSFPEDFSYITLENKGFSNENMNVNAIWKTNVDPGRFKWLIIFYNSSKENEDLLKSKKRTYTFNSDNSIEKNTLFDCYYNWTYFHKPKYSSD